MFHKGDISDLVAVKETIDAWDSIQKRILLEMEQPSVEGTDHWLDWTCILGLLRTMTDMGMLSARISSAIDGIPRKQLETTEPAVIDPEVYAATSSKQCDAAKTWTINPRHVVDSWHCIYRRVNLVPVLRQRCRSCMDDWTSSMMHDNNWRSGCKRNTVSILWIQAMSTYADAYN